MPIPSAADFPAKPHGHSLILSIVALVNTLVASRSSRTVARAWVQPATDLLSLTGRGCPTYAAGERKKIDQPAH